MGGSEQRLLPSVVELEQSVIELFAYQTGSGIWPKYFPLFHYQEAGSNFCFTFELLEALLTEFGRKDSRLLTHERFIGGLELAVAWCERNRLRYFSVEGVLPYEGWNSGGFLETLKDDQPESWATAVVHMFLWELVDALSQHIQERLLDQYEASKPHSPRMAELLDIDLLIGGRRETVAGEIERSIISAFRPFCGENAKTLRNWPPATGRVSALLFGPPGTSKTEIAKAIAAELDWPLVQIDPSHFLKTGYLRIYTQAEAVFKDLDDLAGTVVLFDEMDALVQNRNDASAPPDTESKFLTTFMLPKLVRLHDSRRVIFLMATNFQENFDDAIKRPGRFDLLICMGPPTLEAKCASLHRFYGKRQKTENTEKAGRQLRDLCKENTWVKEQLGLYTFLEFRSLILSFGDTEEKLLTSIEALDAKSLEATVRADAATVRLRLDDAKSMLEKSGVTTIKDLDPQRLLLNELGDRPKPIERYLRDLTQSRRQ